MLFSPFQPMEPLPAAEVPVNERYLFQVKWDGVRILAHVGGGRVLLHNRKLRERTHHYPELDRLHALCATDAVLDGEMVALRNGKPSFPLILERDLVNPAAAGGKEKVRRLMSRVPVFYMVFDLLYYNGRSLLDQPLDQRRERLCDLLQEDESILPVESFGDGVLLFSAIREQGMEGVVAKERLSSYRPGRKHGSWLKIKYRLQQLVVIGGYTLKNGQINALLAGAYHEGRYLYLGRVASGLSGRDLAELTPYLRESGQSEPPFVNATADRDKRWVTPRLTALVEFQEWTEDLRMRQPVILGFTKDNPQQAILA
jgi:bifunctional non-homologous end joining protein LigD